MRDRRQLLKEMVASGFALCAMAPLVRVPDADDGGVPRPSLEGLDVRERWRMEQLLDAWRQAATSGRPLLVILVPERAQRQREVGQAWGELLTAGDAHTIGALSCSLLVTATQAELRRVLPDYRSAAEPLLVRIDADRIPARHQTFSAALRWGCDDIRACIDARVAALEALVRSALPLPLRLRARVLVSAADVEARREQPVPGSRWVSVGACGGGSVGDDPLEDDDYEAYMSADGVHRSCGMAFIDWRSARFLQFLVERPMVPDLSALKEGR